MTDAQTTSCGRLGIPGGLRHYPHLGSLRPIYIALQLFNIGAASVRHKSALNEHD